jgi:hypothetical protein
MDKSEYGKGARTREDANKRLQWMHEPMKLEIFDGYCVGRVVDRRVSFLCQLYFGDFRFKNKLRFVVYEFKD